MKVKIDTLDERFKGEDNYVYNFSFLEKGKVVYLLYLNRKNFIKLFNVTILSIQDDYIIIEGYLLKEKYYELINLTLFLEN
jgi:hypothetical protein